MLSAISRRRSTTATACAAPLPLGEYQGYLYSYDLRQQRMAQQAKPVGRITYASGEEQTFTDVQIPLGHHSGGTSVSSHHRLPL